MNKEEFKLYKKQYGKNIDGWPLYLKREAKLYQNNKCERISNIWLMIIIIVGLAVITIQSVGLVVKIISIMR